MGRSYRVLSNRSVITAWNSGRVAAETERMQSCQLVWPGLAWPGLRRRALAASDILDQPARRPPCPAASHLHRASLGQLRAASSLRRRATGRYRRGAFALPVLAWSGLHSLLGEDKQSKARQPFPFLSRCLCLSCCPLLLARRRFSER